MCTSATTQLKRSLYDLGFIKKGLVEAIVCTFDVSRRPNAAPMGISSEDMSSLILKPFTCTQTYRNLLSNRCATINITSDPEIYSRTLFKDSNSEDTISRNWFSDAKMVDAPYLRMADAYIEARVMDVRGSDTRRATVKCEVVRIIEQGKGKSKAYCRATFATIESLIHATRIEASIREGKNNTAEELINLVQYYANLVNRVAPESIYSTLMEDIQRRIGSWMTVEKST